MPIISQFYGIIIKMDFKDEDRHHQEWKEIKNNGNYFKIEPLK